MQWLPNRRHTHQLFIISITLKAIDGILETIAGIVLFILTPAQIGWIVRIIVREELAEDPRDIFANYFLHTAGNMTQHGKAFTVFFLLSHGLMKAVIVWLLWKKKVWAYPLMMFLLSAFILSQLVEIFHGHSLTLIVVTIFDILIALLTWREYQAVKSGSAR